MTSKNRVTRLLAALAGGVLLATAIGTLTVSPASASTTHTRHNVCDFPEPEVKALDQVETKSAFDEKSKSLFPKALKCLDIKTVDTCTGKTVTLTNWAKWDNKYTTLTVKLGAEDIVLHGGGSANAQVRTLVGNVNVKPKLVIEHDDWRVEAPLPDFNDTTWERPAGCWKVSVTQNCDNTFTVRVTNTGLDAASYELQVAGEDKKSQGPVPAGKTWDTGFNKLQTVTFYFDEGSTVEGPFTYEKPVCTTPTTSKSPTPTPTPSTSTTPATVPQGNDDDLPVTGSALTAPLVGGGILVALGAGLIALLYFRNKREEEAIAQVQDIV